LAPNPELQSDGNAASGEAGLAWKPASDAGVRLGNSAALKTTSGLPPLGLLLSASAARSTLPLNCVPARMRGPGLPPRRRTVGVHPGAVAREVVAQRQPRRGPAAATSLGRDGEGGQGRIGVGEADRIGAR
jgi:hypothetical protein